MLLRSFSGTEVRSFLKGFLVISSILVGPLWTTPMSQAKLAYWVENSICDIEFYEILHISRFMIAHWSLSMNCENQPRTRRISHIQDFQIFLTFFFSLTYIHILLTKYLLFFRKCFYIPNALTSEIYGSCGTHCVMIEISL